MVAQAPKAPGTAAGNRPMPGTCSRPSLRKASTDASAGAGPWPQTERIFRSFSLHTRMGASPPAPFRCGSTTCSTNPPAAAASKALPPRSSTLMAVCEASQWVEEATPKVPVISGRVVKLVIISSRGVASRMTVGPRSGGFRGGGRFRLGAAPVALGQNGAYHQLDLVEQHERQQQGSHGRPAEEYLGHGHAGREAFF